MNGQVKQSKGLQGLKCDIGIVSYNCFPELESCLDSIFSMEKNAVNKVYVVENSKKSIPGRLKKKFSGVTWSRNTRNVGFAAACNQIMEQSAAPYLLIMNPDAEIEKSFINDAMAWMEAHKDTALLGPCITDPDGKIQASARGFPNITTAFFGRKSLLSRFFPSSRMARENLVTLANPTGPIEPDWISGACMLVRKAAVEDVGPMDQGFFMYWEDCDWCTRFRQAGWKVVYHPGLGPVRHAAGSSSRKVGVFTHFHFHRSAARLYIKYDDSPLRAGSIIAVPGALCRFLFLLPWVLMKQRDNP